MTDDDSDYILWHMITFVLHNYLSSTSKIEVLNSGKNSMISLLMCLVTSSKYDIMDT